MQLTGNGIRRIASDNLLSLECIEQYMKDEQLAKYQACPPWGSTVIWVPGEKRRIIIFRRAHKNVREVYHA